MGWMLVGWLTLFIEHLITGHSVSVGDVIITAFLGFMCPLTFLFYILEDGDVAVYQHLLDKTVLKARGDKS